MWEDRRTAAIAVAATLDAAGAPSTDRVMSIDAASTKYWSGRGGVVLVNDPLDTIRDVALAYDIRWLVLDKDDAVPAAAGIQADRPAWLGPPLDTGHRRSGGLSRGVRAVTRREAWLSAAGIFLVALVVRTWFAAQIDFPQPQDAAYYAGVSRNLVEGRGLVSDSIWSYQTPPLEFPRPAFEVWLPLPSILAAIPMALFGATFASSQVFAVVIGAIVPVLAWRLAADVAAERGLSTTPGPHARHRHRPHDRDLPPAPAPLRPARFDDAVHGARPGGVPADEPDRRAIRSGQRSRIRGSSRSASSSA